MSYDELNLKCLELLEKDIFDQEFINNIPIKLKLILFNYVSDKYYTMYKYFRIAEMKGLTIIDPDDLHDYIISTDPEYVWKKIYNYSKYINNPDDVKIFMTNCTDVSCFDSFFKDLDKKLITPEIVDYFINCDTLLSDHGFVCILSWILKYMEGYDEYKEKILLEFPFNSFDASFVIQTLTDQDVIRDAISKVDDEFKPYYIAALSSDDEKEQYLGLFFKGKDIVIKTFKSDKLREKYLKRYWFFMKNDQRKDIIFSFESKEKQDYYFNKLDEQYKVDYLFQQKQQDLDITGALKTREVAKSILIDSLRSLEPKSYMYYMSLISRRAFLNLILDEKFSLYVCLLNDYHSEYIQEFMDYVLGRLNSKNRKKFLKTKIPFETILDNLKYIDKIEDILEIIFDGQYQEMDLREVPKYDDKYKDIFERVSNYYKVPVNRVIELGKMFDITVLNRLLSSNFRSILLYDDEKWEQLKRIFNDNNYELNLNALNDVLNALLAKKFNRDKEHIVSIFHNACNAIINGDGEYILSLFEKMTVQFMLDTVALEYRRINSLPDNEKEAYANELRILEEIYKDEEFDSKLFYIYLMMNDSSALNILHTITNRYITYQKNVYVKEKAEELRETMTMKQYISNPSIRYIFMNNSFDKLLEEFTKLIFNKYRSYIVIDDSDREILMNEDTLRRLICFKKNPSSLEVAPSKEEIKAFNNFLKNNIDSIKNHIVFNEYYVGHNIVLSDLYRGKDNNNILNIMCEIKGELLSNGIFNNPDKFKLLLEFLDKYKILGWGNNFDDILFDSNILFDSSIVASLITYFSDIYDELVNSKIENILSKYSSRTKEDALEEAIQSVNLSGILEVAVAFAPNYLKYSMLLGSEDFKYIITDVGQYRSSLSKIEKMNCVSNLYVEAYKRDVITVPPVDKDYELRNGKKLNVVVGNVTSPVNLSLGERTSACMRMGGFATTLYRFALENKNGFHIRFHNPETGELVSRVTGFRNGNTVFLNQLRYSLDENYEDKDLVDVIQLVANDLIEMSRGSEYPIDNVVINRGYAMSVSNLQIRDFGVSDLTKGFEPVYDDRSGLTNNLYHDVSNYDVVLATSNPNKRLVPVKLDPNKVTKYKPQRDKVRLLSGRLLCENVDRINSLDSMLNGLSFEDLSLIRTKDLDYGYVGEDFYCVVTKTGRLMAKIMDSRKNNKDALKEYSEVCNKMKLAVLKEEVPSESNGLKV